MSLKWEEIQARYADVPAEEGIALRQRHYPPFFLRFGRDVRIQEGCRFFKPERIVLEDDARINIGGLFYGSGGLVIGRHARIGPRCFVHSANHDVSPNDPRAFFERGYDYRRTVVGDNTLISANVSILPGCNLGHGSFVACGAVVSGTVYPDSSRLFGIPARNRSPAEARPPVSEAPELAFLVPADRQDLADAADLLREVLGLPQLVRLTTAESVPPSIAAVFCFGGAAPEEETGAEIWRLEAGQRPLDANRPLRLPGEEEISLPISRTLVTRPIPAAAAPAAERLPDVGYWLHARLFKRSDPLRDGEFREWLVALSLLDWPEERKRPVLKKLWDRCPEGLDLSAPRDTVAAAETIRRWMDASQWPPGPPGKARQAQGGLAWLKQRLHRFSPRSGRRRNRNFTTNTILGRPVDLVWLAASAAQPEEAAHLKALVEEIVPHCKSSLQWVSVGLAAHLLDQPSVLEKARAMLALAERRPPRGGLLRQLPERPQLLLSPLYAAWLLLIEAGSRQLPADFMTAASSRQDLVWRGFAGSGSSWTLGEGQLVDEHERRVSEDLLQNWLTLQTAPCAAGSCLDLLPEAYGPAVARLERIWLALLTQLLHRNGRPLIRLRPWPAPYRAALSLRYDVDRPISISRVHQLVGLEARYANAPLGSWYFRAGDLNAERLRYHLALRSQEAGVHVENLNEVAAGDGVTHHSAPTSAYWQGDHTTRVLAERGATYGEFHATALFTPRRAWLAPAKPEDGIGRRGETMLTPLHFPLEAGTDDHGLAYFDCLLLAFHERLDQGGHAIIGSHPDLDQEPLKMLFAREAATLQDVWMAPVADVVNRWRQVMTPGRFKIAIGQQGERVIVAADSVVDLALVIHEPSGKTRREVLQLSPGMPRPIASPQNKNETVAEDGLE